jgi:hypothetical protein
VIEVMDPQLHNNMLLVAGAALFALAKLAWVAGSCHCGKCAYHVNENRMARHRKDEARHQAAHRAWGSCGDDTCPLAKKDKP